MKRPSISRSPAAGRAPLRAIRITLLVHGVFILVGSAVANSPPTVVTAAGQVVFEGSVLDMSGDPGTPVLGFFSDADQSDTHQSTVDWGDGRDFGPTTIDPVPEFYLLGASHIYADDGNYPVTVTVTDNHGASGFSTFSVIVLNVVPTLTATASSTSIQEGQSVQLDALFSDPGFDNPVNPLPPANGGQLSESFRYYLNWGDGVGTVASQDVADINGAPGVESTGSFSTIHSYSQAGIYAVSLRLADDDMGAYGNSSLFVTGIAGVDYVEQSFLVFVSAIPEPTPIVLTLAGLACLLAKRQRMRR
jgi:hypothetical protein